VGAIVLVSLVVIFVPMLVEEESAVSPHITETNIPLRPVLPEPSEDAAPVAASQDTEATPADSAPTTGPGISLPLPTAESAATPSPTAPKPEAQAEAITEPTPPKPSGSEAPPPPSKPEPAPSKPSGWVVQVASFSDQTNADQTLARLRLAGYDSFVEEIRVKDKVLYRVRVGPEVQRQQADALQAKIAKELKLNGQVQRYP